MASRRVASAALLLLSLPGALAAAGFSCTSPGVTCSALADWFLSGQAASPSSSWLGGDPGADCARARGGRSFRAAETPRRAAL